MGDPTVAALSIVCLFDWLLPFMLVTGIAGWVSDALPDVLGVAAIAAVLAGSAALRKLVPAEPVPNPHRGV